MTNQEHSDVGVAHGSVLIVDDHMMVAQAMGAAMRAEGFSPVEHVPPPSLSVEGVIDVAERLRPAAALVDLDLGGDLSGFPVIATLSRRGVKVIAFSASESPMTAAEALDAGAEGFLNKAEPFDVIADHVRRMVSGESLVGVARRAELLAALHDSRRANDERLRVFASLSPKEREVLRGLIAGKPAQEIAEESYLSIRTVRSHIEAIRTKLKVKSQLAAVALAREAGWKG